jgi:hypothetical protein
VQLELPGEIAFLGIEGVIGRQAGKVGTHRKRPHAVKDTEKLYRVVAAGEKSGPRLEADAPARARGGFGLLGAVPLRGVAPQLGEALDQRRIPAGVVGLLLARRPQRVAHVVDAREHGVHGVGVGRELAVAQVVEHMLELVREAAYLGETEAARRPLDGVDGAEYRVEQLRRLLAGLQSQEVGLRAVQAFQAFGKKAGVELPQVN